MSVKSILVVDDDEAILMSFKAILESKGYSVDIAGSGREAVAKAEEKPYSLALLDIKLPDMEGTTLLAKIHRIVPSMMKIMVTGYPSLDNAVKALNHGADAYVIKPVKPQELLNVVDEKLREQEEAESMDEARVAEWIKARIKKLEEKNHTS